MRKIIAMLLATFMILVLVACAPEEDPGTTVGTTEAVAKGPVHCICGANEGEDHIGLCTGEEVEWTPWDGNSLPTESGYYYAAHEADEVTLNYTDYTMNLAAGGMAREIVVDLDGKTFKGPGDQQVVLDAVMSLTITDSSTGHKGSIIADAELTPTRMHSLFHLADAEGDTSCTLNVYRVTLDTSALKDSSKDGSVISVMASNALHMYGATVRGGTVIGNGGAIYNAGTVVLRDCVVYGGEVKAREDDTGIHSSGLGGAICTLGDVRMVDCTIYGAPAGRGGAMHIAGGDTVMEGGTIYGANVTKSACAINMKAGTEDPVSFTMKSGKKGDPVIDASQNASGGFAGAINIDGYIARTEFTMECGEIKGGRILGAGGGAVLVQDTLNDGADLRGVFIMNGGTVIGGFADSESGQGGGAFNVNTGGALYLNGGTITGGKDISKNKAGGIYLIKGNGKLVIGGEAKVTGNEGCDVYVATGNSITIADDWAGNGDAPLVIGLQDGKGVFAVADEGAALTDAHVDYFTTEEGTVELVDNTLKIN